MMESQNQGRPAQGAFQCSSVVAINSGFRRDAFPISLGTMGIFVGATEDTDRRDCHVVCRAARHSKLVRDHHMLDVKPHAGSRSPSWQQSRAFQSAHYVASPTDRKLESDPVRDEKKPTLTTAMRVSGATARKM